MKVVAILSILLGILMFTVGWLLNTNTPMQNRLPVWGMVLVLAGVLTLLIRGLFT